MLLFTGDSPPFQLVSDSEFHESFNLQVFNLIFFAPRIWDGHFQMKKAPMMVPLFKDLQILEVQEQGTLTLGLGLGLGFKYSCAWDHFRSEWHLIYVLYY